MEDFEYARDKVLMGPKREEVLLGDEKEKTAYHEAGHALIAWLTKGADRVHKVTVIPRGRALGVTQTLPEEDRMNIAEGELQDRLAFLLGGRAAEKLVYDEFSAGAENDLERATALARRMVTKWGMSEQVGAGQLQDERRRPVPGTRDPPAAAVQRTHVADHRRGGRSDPARGIRPGPGDSDREPRANWTSWRKRSSNEKRSTTRRSSN